MLEIVSGGQAGVDRAALDAALELGVPCGGWCPAGRRAEDGPIDARYPLRETPSADPSERTARNVRDSDATLILAGEPLRGGTSLTREIAERAGKPLFVADPAAAHSVEAVRAWLAEAQPERLNVAGPRESEAPGIHAEAMELLRRVLSPGTDG